MTSGLLCPLSIDGGCHKPIDNERVLMVRLAGAAHRVLVGPSSSTCLAHLWLPSEVPSRMCHGNATDGRHGRQTMVVWTLMATSITQQGRFDRDYEAPAPHESTRLWCGSASLKTLGRTVATNPKGASST